MQGGKNEVARGEKNSCRSETDKETQGELFPPPELCHFDLQITFLAPLPLAHLIGLLER